MSLRTKVALLATGMIMASMLTLGSLVIAYQRTNHLEELELRARSFLSVLGVELTESLASNRIEDLDKLIARLLDRDLATLDISFVAVLDQDRRIMAHTDQSRYGAMLDDRFSQDALESSEPLVHRETRDGQDLLLVSMPVSTALPGLPGIRWGTLIAGMGLERAHREISRLIWRVLLLLVIVIAAAAGITVLVLNHQLVRPVGELAGVARRFAAGSMEARVRVRGSGELALLGETYNDMAGRIESYTRSLEDKVRERTRDLEEANAKLNKAMDDIRHANRRLEELATTDGLTGLFNHRHFKGLLEVEVSRSKRLDFPTSLVMLDVDHFKQYNDTHGHPAGDLVLRDLSELLRSRLRGTDVPCRYGGEEFAVILLDTGKQMAMAVAEEIRSRIEATPFEGQESQPGGSLTVSIGVATFPEDAEDQTALLRAADEALYAAKRGGRNQVVNAGARAASESP
ncbi:MAG: diguanylate cyclase [Pseudomonadota bacterium]